MNVSRFSGASKQESDDYNFQILVFLRHLPRFHISVGICTHGRLFHS